ncbi:MAG: hypothetical protein KJO07_18320 [Deltaproteobacteria bacterium]|nr:hypothetical protein [Deltaproteobacteria bacterium]
MSARFLRPAVWFLVLFALGCDGDGPAELAPDAGAPVPEADAAVEPPPPLQCVGVLIECGGECVNPNSDFANCGGCGVACDADEVCNGEGQCADECSLNLPVCNETCVDPETDPMFCGASGDCTGDDGGVECTELEACESGACVDRALSVQLSITNLPEDDMMAGEAIRLTGPCEDGATIEVELGPEFSSSSQTATTCTRCSFATQNCAVEPNGVGRYELWLLPIGSSGPRTFSITQTDPAGNTDAALARTVDYRRSTGLHDAGSSAGERVAIGGDTVAVADITESGLLGDATFGYTVAIYRDPNGDGNFDDAVREALLSSSTIAPAGYNSGFGTSLAVSDDGERVVIGAHEDASSLGSVYVYQRSGNGTWSLEQQLDNPCYYSPDYPDLAVPTPCSAREFGTAVSMSAGRIAVSAPLVTAVGATERVWIFEKRNGSWYPEATVTQGGGIFGRSLALTGTTLVVGDCCQDGAPGDSSLGNTGRVYVYQRQSASNWSLRFTVQSPSPEAFGYFGDLVAASGDLIAVGARGEGSTVGDPAGPGRVHVYEIDGAVLHHRTTLAAEASLPLESTGPSILRDFGDSIAIDGDRIVVGAPTVDLSESIFYGNLATAYNAGVVYDYSRSGDDWQLQRWLRVPHSRACTPPTDCYFDSDLFGAAVAADGDRVVVGAPGYVLAVDSQWSRGGLFVFD